MNIMKTQQN